MATKLVFVPSATRERDEPLKLFTLKFSSATAVCSWTLGSLRSTSPSSSSQREGPSPWSTDGMIKASFQMQTPPMTSPKGFLLSSASSNGPSLHPSRQRHESETVGEDWEVRLPHATASVSLPQHSRPHHEQFEPNLGKPARGGGGPYGTDQGGKG